ncbi:AmmeMemoRadiSam system radical SAM enzyme [Candidatus Aminicenantes bacterium AH-873-B07]|jgi:pyruvate formate lyase activating enzyme|nr:AmmeMemoRadiSam system radical SAM enzyme [Candidatus Aminicenantes bacterium AH-873-B07]
MKEALFYELIRGEKIKCNLCRHRCVIYPDKTGVCGVRLNSNSKLYTLVYGKLIAVNVDPIEKKPLYHFFPGSLSFSIATIGCNFSCPNCQNYTISQYKLKGKEDLSIVPGENYAPNEIVSLSLRHNCKTIAYTYTEPTIFYEFAFDTAKIAYSKNIKNIFVTNGYITPEALKELSLYLDAANVDLKSFRKDFYQKYPKAKLEGVLDTLKLMKRFGIWIEVTTLLIPTLNDRKEELKDIARFIKNELGEETPWHISRFYPAYEMTYLPPTSSDKLMEAREIGLEEGLRYVYTGNVPGLEGENTYCWNCKKLIIRRYGYSLSTYKIKDGKCEHCGAKIDGIGF